MRVVVGVGKQKIMGLKVIELFGIVLYQVDI
jgi:hypothetical protein